MSYSLSIDVGIDGNNDQNSEGVRPARFCIQAAIWPKNVAGQALSYCFQLTIIRSGPKTGIEEALDHDEAGDSGSDFDFLFS